MYSHFCQKVMQRRMFTALHNRKSVAVDCRMTASSISGAFLHKDTALCHTFTKIGTNEEHTMMINLRPWSILGVTAFCQILDKIQYGRRPSIYMQFYPFYGYLRGKINCTVSDNHSKNIPAPFVTGLWTSFGRVNVIFSIFGTFSIFSSHFKVFFLHFRRYFVVIIIVTVQYVHIMKTRLKSPSYTSDSPLTPYLMRTLSTVNSRLCSL